MGSPANNDRFIDLPALEFRAVVAPKSIDNEKRTVDLTFSTGAPVERVDWGTGERFIERLSMDPAHVRLERLNNGAPLLDTHGGYSIASMLGAVVPGTAKMVAGQGRGTVQFSRRAEVEPVWRDVQDGIVSSVSVGYRVHAYEERAAKAGALKTRTAVDWEPYEVSMVPMPADTGAHTRSESGPETNRCIVRTIEEIPTMERTPSEFVAEDPLAAGLAAPATPAPPAAPATEPTDRDRGAISERERTLGIIAAVRGARLPQAKADAYIASGRTLVDIQSEIFRELERRDPPVPNLISNNGGTVEMNGPDPNLHLRAGIENALLHRIAPQAFKLEDVGREYRGMTLLDIARVYLHAQRIRTTGMSKMDLAGLALGLNVRAGYHTTSDYPNLLADVAAKTLRAAYEAAPQTFTVIGRRVTLSDFKPVKRLQLGEAPSLLEVNEHGEYKRGTIGEGKEQFQLATYGRVFAITRKALINDDTDAFSRVPALFGRSARNLESDLAWEQITANAAMGDSIAVFHASHGNLADDGDPISIDTLGAGRAAMRLQTGLDGATYLNIVPKYLLVPTSLETVADQFVSNITPAVAGQANPFTGRLTVVPEPRLDATSQIAWYLAASPDQIDMLEYAYLEGEDGPAIESRIGFDIDGLEIKCRHDFAAKLIDYRGFYRNDGDQVS